MSMRRELARTDATWPATVILITGAMLLTSWFPPLWIFVLPPIIKARQKVKQRHLYQQWAIKHNAWLTQTQADDRAFIAAMKSV